MISNLGPLMSAIDIIYFDATPNHAITAIDSGASVGTVAFALGGNPTNLPSGNNAVPAFVSQFNASSTSNANRIDAARA